MISSLRLALLLLATLPLSLTAQSNAIGYPAANGPTNVGTEFYLSFPANWDVDSPVKYVRLYMTAGTRTEVIVSGGNGYLDTVETVPNDIVTIDIPIEVAQAFLRNDRDPVPNDTVYEDAAIRIVADDPITVYGMNRANFTSDGLIALPTNALGRRYVVASARSVATGQQELPSQFMVVAPHDNTRVRLIYTFKTPNHDEGDTVEIDLDAGDVYSAMSVGFRGDLSGTIITANNPIAVLGGQNCTYLPDERYPACDHIVEMLAPVESWGTEYYSLPFADRTKGDTYRIFAGDDDAEVSLNGTLLATLPRVGGVNGSGWIEYRQDERGPMVFSSDKPIHVVQYNNSQTYDQSTATDPFMMILSPSEQSVEDVVITTPGSDFPKNYLQVIGDSATLEATEVIRVGSTGGWTDLYDMPGTIGPFDFVGGTNRVRGVTIEIEPGVWRIRGTQGAFSAYIYGGGSFDSYGYPAAMATANLESVDTTAPAALGELDERSGVVDGRAVDPFEQATTSGLSTVRLDPQSSNYRLTVDPFRPGIDTVTGFRLEPIDPTQAGTAIVTTTDMAGNMSSRTVSYEACEESITFSLDTLDLGTTERGVERQGMLTISNDGEVAVVITSLDLRGEGFSMNVDPAVLPVVLQPGESLTLRVSLQSETEGEYSGAITARLGCGPDRVVEIRGRVGDMTDVPVERRGLMLDLAEG